MEISRISDIILYLSILNICHSEVVHFYLQYVYGEKTFIKQCNDSPHVSPFQRKMKCTTSVHATPVLPNNLKFCEIKPDNKVIYIP